MREWQVGDPIGDGNDIGVPDIPYMGYLKKIESMKKINLPIHLLTIQPP